MHTPDDDEERCTKVILEQEEELFDVECKGIRWGVVQLYRMLAVVLINTIVLNPIFRCFWFVGLFVGFSYHDGYRMPFKHPFLNHLQRLTSACLFFVTLCNFPSAVSSIGDITAIQNMDICLKALRYLELFQYMIVLLALPTWKMREKYIELVQSRKKNN